MIALQVQNNQYFEIKRIPFFTKKEFHDNISDLLSQSFRIVGLFSIDKEDPDKIVSVLAQDKSTYLYILGCDFDKNDREFESWVSEYPQTDCYECELAEEYGLIPVGHPRIHPVRKQNVVLNNQPYDFYTLDGDETHEVAVGPIHAGVIEPGHFRFNCHGETVYNLEINLGYQRRGVESLILNAPPVQRIILSESISGDTVIGHAYAHCALIESLSDTKITLRAMVIRSIAEELERIAMHISGLLGMANDVGYAIVSSSYGRLRTLVINSLAELCGSRFGRGLFIYGGVRFDLDDDITKTILKNIKLVRNHLKHINDALFSTTSALIRFDNVGALDKQTAINLGLLGPSARSCGIEIDARVFFPYGAYRYFPISPVTLPSGDSFARARIRALEIEESFRFIFELFENIPSGAIKSNVASMKSSAGVISIVEGWRGEIVHSAFTDRFGNLVQYKIIDPSFVNWNGLSMALRGNAISDFPICNKSFDLSYAGRDL